MKNKHIARIFAGACMMLSLMFLTACDENEGGGKTELDSFGPTGVKHGEEIVFIGRNLDDVKSVVFQPNVEVTKDNFTSVKSNELRLVVPTSVESGKVVLKTSSGDIESKSIFSLEVPVTITGFTAEAKPGTNITITGEFVNWIESVEFTDGLLVTDFVSKSLTEVVVTVPMTAKTGFIKINTGGTEPLEITMDEPLDVTLPEVSDLDANPIRHAQDLTVTGTDLDLVAAIKFPDGSVVEKGEFKTQELTKIVLTVPVTATEGQLTLIALSDVEVKGGPTLVISLPKVTSFAPSDPSEQEVPGTTLTITGTDLDLVAKIKFPGVATPVTEFTKSATQITVVVPAGVQGGTMVFTTIHDFVVPVSAPFGNQLTLLAVIFDDAVKSPFGKGGWGSPDIANTEQVRVGSKAIKSTFTGGYSGGGQFGTWGNSPLSTSGTTYFAFSIYGGSGTQGKTVLINIAGAPQQQVTVDEGKWKDVKIALSSMGSPASISELSFQDANWSGVVYLDQIGLK